MADKDKDKQEEVEIKSPTIKQKPKTITGTIVNKSSVAYTVEYKVSGISYGARVDYNVALHSNLGVGDEIQIPI